MPAWERAGVTPDIDGPLPTAFTSGSEHVVRHANASFLRLVDLSPERVVGRPLPKIFEGHAATALRALLDVVLESGKANAAFDIAIGTEARRHVIALASPGESASTTERGLRVYVVETTERVEGRLAQQRTAGDARLANEALLIAALREQESAERAHAEVERWSALVENLDEGVTVFDAEGNVVLVNGVGSQLLGLRHQEKLTKLSQSAYVARCTLQTLDGLAVGTHRHPATRALAGESFSDEELVLARPGRACRRLLFSGSRVRDATGASLAINVYSDVTERHELEELRGEFLSLVSHDLRSPLQAVLGTAELLVESLEGDADIARATARAKTIVRVTTRMGVMLDDLYRSSEVESARVAVALVPIDISVLLGNVCETIGDAASRTRVGLEVAADLPRVSVDVPKMERALLNLVTNALKYSKAAVTLRAAAADGELSIEIIDRGDGIAPEDLPHVFEKYRRTRSAQRVEGLGLGLYITRRIVELHGGRVECESVVGEGSRFVVTLPTGGNRG